MCLSLYHLEPYTAAVLGFAGWVSSPVRVPLHEPAVPSNPTHPVRNPVKICIARL